MPKQEKPKEMPAGRKRLYTALSKISLTDLNTIEWKRARELFTMLYENDLPGAKSTDDE